MNAYALEQECCRGCRGTGLLVRSRMIVGPMTRRAARAAHLVPAGPDPGELLLDPGERGSVYVRQACRRCGGAGYARVHS